jgi:peptidoglycan hydrolase CwlO-like protein
MFYSFNTISELKAFLSFLFLILDGSLKFKLAKQHVEEVNLKSKVQELESNLSSKTVQAEKWLNDKKELQSKVTKLEMKLHGYKTQIKQLNSQLCRK